jgi:hypothetical protein
MTGGSESTVSIGQWIIVSGLCVQLVFFGAFVLSAFLFHGRIARHPTAESESTMRPTRFVWPRDWRGLLFACYIVSLLIVIRSVYRLIEFIGHEVFLYVFDASMMFIAMVVMNLFHPSAVLQSDNTIVQTSEPKTSETHSRFRSEV